MLQPGKAMSPTAKNKLRGKGGGLSRRGGENQLRASRPGSLSAQKKKKPSRHGRDDASRNDAQNEEGRLGVGGGDRRAADRLMPNEAVKKQFW